MNTRVLWQSCVVVAAGCFSSGLSLAQSTMDCSSVAEDRARLKCYDEQAARQKKAAAAAAAQAATTAQGGALPPAATTVPGAASTPAPTSTPVPTSSPSAASASGAASPKSAHAATGTTERPNTAATSSRPVSASSDFGLNEEALRKRQAAANPDAAKDTEQLTARVTAVAKKPRGEYRITLEGGQVWEETQHTSSSIPPGVGDTVTIKRGMLGSYFLERGSGLALRVKRTD